ncbi:MAG: isochorismatase family protein [Dehalococcoidia bacterium]|nr:isochorismatase family protein [Dehalococcoidia bacterium]
MVELNREQVLGDGVLILIDMQNDVVKRETDGRYELPSERAAFVENCRSLVEWTRGNGIPVFFVKVDRRADGSDVPAAQLGSARRARLVEGSVGNQIIDELSPAEQDYVVVKRRIGAFHATPLDLYLRCLNKSTIVIGGFATNWGVESTVRAAWDHDYQVVVVSDACAAFSDEEHEFAVKRTFPARSAVITTAQLVG